jgi:hypothetical protein
MIALLSLLDWLSSVSGSDVAILGLIVAVFALLASLFRNWYASRQIRLSSVIEILQRMEKVREDRQILYKIRNGHKSYEEWADPEKDAADRVAREFDILGVLDSTLNIDRKFVDRFYAVPAAEIWEIVAPHVEFKRIKEKRGKHHLWEFEQLADRVKYVKRNHPADNDTTSDKTSDKKKWPPFPRRKRPYIFW